MLRLISKLGANPVFSAKLFRVSELRMAAQPEKRARGLEDRIPGVAYTGPEPLLGHRFDDRDPPFEGVQGRGGAGPDVRSRQRSVAPGPLDDAPRADSGLNER
jgi:hypothetical protein